MSSSSDFYPHILLIDDDEDEYLLLGEALLLYSSRVALHQLSSSEQVLPFLMSLAQLPSLILLDFNVPPGSALEVLGVLKQNERTRSIPVIVRSGSLQGDQVTQCYQAGANSVLLKSDNQTELVATTRQLCQYWFENALLPS